MNTVEKIKLEKIDSTSFRIPKTGRMNVEGIVYADHSVLTDLKDGECLKQVANVACLPGILRASMAMPDIHWGYGFPIGGVAAFDLNKGVVSPGGVGYDINCGVRLMRSDLSVSDVRPKMESIVDTLFKNIPSGIGSRRDDFKIHHSDYSKVLENGARWAVSKGFGSKEDLNHIEEGGRIEGADPEIVSQRAKERGRDQLGTLGSGNHFVEVGFVDEIYDGKAATALGLFKDGVTVFVHTGSRGLGYQVCDDSIGAMLKASKKYGIELTDKQLCCAPLSSKEGKNYLSAMACAANFAFANRQMITHWVRESFESVFFKSSEKLGFDLIYDVAHNIAKIEEHIVGGEIKKVCVHRKGATRAFPPKSKELPDDYKRIGQPVLIPGDMGRYSYVLLGTQKAYETTFGSTCHGAGRVMSRRSAMKAAKGRNITRELEDRGVLVRAASRATLVEEIPDAYKDVADVINVVNDAGLSKKVARLRPLAVIKG